MSLRTLHREAMAHADEALLARKRGNTAEALVLSRAAFEKEKQAAMTLAVDVDAEPTRSVLFRSAATLALDCHEEREAEQLVAMALAGNPPAEIAEELRDLFEQVSFQRHLALRGVTLSQNEIQFSVAGPAVGLGIASPDAVLERVKVFETLVYRTAERSRGRPYREQGRRSKALEQEVATYMTVPRAASFAVTLVVGAQQVLPGFGLAEQVIIELLGCFELLEDPNPGRLRERIGDQSYYANFVALARRIAPDGRDVNLVGLTAVQDGNEKRIMLTRPRRAIEPVAAPPRTPPAPAQPPPLPPPESQGARVVLKGPFKLADSRSEDTAFIEVQGRMVRVPHGMMTDTVVPLYGRNVVVEAIDRDDGLTLVNIDED